MYVITSLDGISYLCQKNPASKCNLSTNRTLAMEFETRAAAERYIENCLPKSLRKCYKISKDNECFRNTQKEGCKMQQSDIVSRIQDFAKIAHDAKSHLSKIGSELDVVENKLVDMYHYIAIKDLDVVRGYKIYKQLQSLLRERRKLKDEKKLSEAFLRDLETSNYNFDSYTTAESLLHTRTYTPRVMPELFDDE